MSENTGGRLRRDPAGISSDKPSENLGRRKSKVSWERLIRSGLVGPKARPNGVADGHPVNIPELRWRRYYDGGTRKDRRVEVKAYTICQHKRDPTGKSVGSFNREAGDEAERLQSR